MIQKLRRKFVIINMILVSSVLVAVLAALLFTSARSYKSDSINTLQRLLMQGNEPFTNKPELNREPPANDANSPNTAPAFVVTLDENLRYASMKSNDIAQIEESFAQEAANAVLNSGQQQGMLSDMRLRFMRDSEQSTKIAFVSTTHELNGLKKLLLTSAAILIGAAAAFFIISLFLSRWALRPVEQAWEQQSQFVADASHELKTPLTVILANHKILLTHKNDTIANQTRWIESTQAEAARMKELVESMLFLARSESTVVEKSAVNFSDLVLNCFLQMESLAFEHGVTMEEKITPDLMVVGNEGQLKQLLIILLDNACKYAEQEKRVTVSLAPLQEKIVLKVINTGKPVAKEELARLFERFYRSDKSRVRKQGGYGLGLSIAQTIVTSHKGKITADSQDHTTLFQVTLPLEHVPKNI